MRTPHVESLEARLCLSVTDIDPTFGSGGTVTPTFPAGTQGTGGPFMTDDGDLVLYHRYQGAAGPNYQVEVADVAPDGSVRWVSRVPQAAVNGTLDVSAVARQPDGKVVLAIEDVYGITGSLRLDRLNADGSIDTGFHPAATPGGGERPIITALASGADGSVLAAGGAGYYLNTFNLLRLAPDGSLQTTFDTGNTFIPGSDARQNVITALAEQPDGKVVAAGYIDLGRRHLAVERFNADGSLDTSFGDGGKVVTDLRLAPHDLVIDASGRILVSAAPRGGIGFSYGDGLQPYVVALTPGGQFDASFGTGGVVADAGGLDQMTDFRVAGDRQSIYVAGTRGGQPAIVQLAATDGTVEAAARGSNIVTGNRPYVPALWATSDGHLISMPTAGTFQRSVGLSVPQPPADGVSPSVALGRLRRVAVGSSSYSVSVAYTDAQSGVDPQTLGRTNVILRPPGKPPIRASSAAVARRGSTWTVTYTFAAPGNSWGAEDAGTYRIQVVGAQVTDNAGDAVGAATLGSFTIPAAGGAGSGLAAARRLKRVGDV